MVYFGLLDDTLRSEINFCEENDQRKKVRLQKLFVPTFKELTTQKPLYRELIVKVRLSINSMNSGRTHLHFSRPIQTVWRQSRLGASHHPVLYCHAECT